MQFLGLYWWIDRWRKSTAYTDLTLAEQGAYRNLLDEAHLRGGPIPNNERILAKACGDATAWPEVRTAVLAKFDLRPDGWHNSTLDQVIFQTFRRARNQAKYRERLRKGDNEGGNGSITKPITARSRADNKGGNKRTNKAASLGSGSGSGSGSGLGIRINVL